MTRRHAISFSVWLGLGLGLARATPVAHACSCSIVDTWTLEFESIDDVSEPGVMGDLEAEQSNWPIEAEFIGQALLLGDGHYVDLIDAP